MTNDFERYNFWHEEIKSNMGGKFIKTKIEGFINESKVASDESPIGFYTIANAILPIKFFNRLNELNIEHKHDKYSNFIEVFVKDMEEAYIVRKLALGDTLEADDISDDDLPYMTPEEIGDAMEIKLK